MIEGQERAPFPVNQKVLEESGLTDSEEARQAFKLLEGEAAQAVLRDFWDPMITQEEFAAKIEEFNALPPEARGKGRIEAKTLESRRVREAALTHPKGYPYTVSQDTDGTLTLRTQLTGLS